eukprot:76696-Pelagomonas_calceolata.AAC.1
MSNFLYWLAYESSLAGANNVPVVELNQIKSHRMKMDLHLGGSEAYKIVETQLFRMYLHVHLIEIKHCEEMRPGQQSEAAQLQHADLR